MRTLARELAESVGKQVTIEGWLHKKRLMGGLNFIVVRDRSGVVQALVADKDEVEKLRALQLGTVLSITGSAVADERAPGGAELHDVTLEVQVPVTDESPIEIDKPLSHKSDNLDTLFDNRVVGLRNLQETKIFKIRAELLRYIREFLHERDFTEINTPKLVAGASECGA
jgi:nondiscriminating aspartyl-tRNA synthetase